MAVVGNAITASARNMAGVRIPAWRLTRSHEPCERASCSSEHQSSENITPP